MNTMKKTSNTPTRIILSGLAGAGKSSVGKALAEQLGFTFYPAGSYAREEAEKRGITIQELQIQLKDEPNFDRQLDNQLIEWGQRTDGWVMDYRLGFALLPEATSIYLTVEDAEAVHRISAASRAKEFSGDESTEDMLASIRERNENMRSRLKGLYQVDFTDRSQYDHVISTDDKTINEIIDDIIDRIAG
jgi:predicted cytidylate kinase